MQEVNYIQHLLAVFQQFHKDSRLNPQHISLYMALFQYWNLSRFRVKFFISRQEVMHMAKIGSTATYHKCLKQLSQWKYLKYFPSKNPYKGSEVKMFIFETSHKQDLTEPQTSLEHDLIPNTNNLKTNKNSLKQGAPSTENEVLEFFKNKEWPTVEGKKFYLHYQSLGWELRKDHLVKDWKALAEKWMLREHDHSLSNTDTEKWDHLKTPKDKNYNEPL